jgi:hypothetical protein
MESLISDFDLKFRDCEIDVIGFAPSVDKALGITWLILATPRKIN